MKNFNQDLKLGKHYEKMFAQYLADEHNYTQFKYNDDDRFDLIAIKHTPEGTFSKIYEIKYDKAHTQNLAIEVGCVKRAKATGLWATQAHWFVYMKDQMWWIFKTEDLKKYLTENEVHITRGGDNKNALIFLLPEKDTHLIASSIIKL